MLKLNVGLSRKVGEANYGSRGASVHLELEVESTLAADAKTLQERIRSLFRLARSAVDEELTGHASTGSPSANGPSNGHPSSGSSNGATRPAPRPATASQVRAIHAIAGRLSLDLTGELRSRYGVGYPEQLSITQASELIDALKAQPAGNGSRR